MSLESVQTGDDTKIAREGIPAAWSTVRESFFASSRSRMELR